MDRSQVISLVKSTRAQNDFGVWTDDLTSRDVFCQVDSVTRNEFFEGGRNGLNPEYRFTLFFGDYEGERIVVYQGMAYAVYRTFQGRNDTIELYCERQGGVNGQKGTG